MNNKTANIISLILVLLIISVLFFWVIIKYSLAEKISNISIFQGNRNQETFSFAVVADPHMDDKSDPDMFKQTLNNIVKEKDAFAIDLGDTFMIDKLETQSEENIRARYVQMKNYYNLLGSIPLYFVVGNHDGETGWDKVYARDYRMEYFPEQDYGKNYHSFEKNNALFVILDPFTYTTTKPKDDGWQWTLGKEQYDWLRKTLETSDAKYKFVFTHQLVGSGSKEGRGGIEYAEFHEWGGNNPDGSFGFETERPGWGEPIHQLLVDNNVNIVFKGHDHFFAKQELDGVVYQTCPQPSHPGDKVTTAEEYGYFAGDILPGSGFMNITISPEGAKIDYVRTYLNKDSEIEYSYSID